MIRISSLKKSIEKEEARKQKLMQEKEEIDNQLQLCEQSLAALRRSMRQAEKIEADIKKRTEILEQQLKKDLDAVNKNRIKAKENEPETVTSDH